MQKLMRFSHAHPWLVLLILSGITALAVYQIPHLKQDPSAEGLMVENDPARFIYEDTLDTFGTDKIGIVFVQDQLLFTPEKLTRFEDLVYALEGLSGVSRVESLFSVSTVKNEGGDLYSGPLMEQIPETREEAQQVLKDALANPILVGGFVSKDGSATAIKLFLDPDPDDANYYGKISDRISDLLKPLQSDFERVFQVGNYHLRTVMSDMMSQDQRRLVPLSMLALLVGLVLTTGSLSGAVLPLLTSGISILLTLGFMSLAHIPLNILTIIVPSLTIVIGSTEDIHLLSEYFEGTRVKKERKLAIDFMIAKMGTVVMITALTTFLGFLAICLNKITILRQFGMAASFALLVNPIVTSLLAPTYFRFFGSHPRNDGDKESHQPGRLFFEALGKFFTGLVTNKKKAVMIIFLGISAVIGLFGVRVQLNNDVMGVFKKNAPVIQQLNEMGRELGGVQSFFIRISGGHKGIFKDPKNLEEVLSIQDFIRKERLFDKTVSLVDFLQLIHREMMGDDASPGPLPKTRAKVSQYLLFLQDDVIAPYVNHEFNEINIIVSHNLSSSHELKRALNRLQAFMDESLNPHFKYVFTGESILTLRAADSIAWGQAKSISLLLIIIFIIMSVLFLNMKAGLLSLIPNVLPIVIYFGVMGLFNVPLNIGTAMVAAIAIGIAVDDTIHFMVRYNAEMHHLKSQEEAMRVCINAEIRPVFSTSIALTFGFLVLTLSNFVTIIHFATLSAVVMVVALLCDMLVTPILLSSTQLLTLWDMVSLKLRKEIIEQSEFFRDMRPWQIKKIILHGLIKEARAGEIVYHEWEKGDGMALVLEGRAHAYSVHEDTGKEVTYAQFSPGDTFGEIAMLDSCPRSANVRAATDLKFVEITRDGFHRLQQFHPHIASKAFRNLARILGHRLAITAWMYLQKAGD
ncbi:MAG: MMPL family transporter [Deltaproteobacteria bacterium]|nr:MMPL family transporter [Deltaproteobacteria bacterium]